MPGENRTKIQRNRNKTLVNGVGAAALFLLAYFMATKATHGGQAMMSYLLAFIAAAPGLFLLYRAYATTGVGECPGCDMYILDISTRSNMGVLCPSCSRYVESEKGELILSPDSRVASFPMFRTEVPEQIRWPDGCCVCGEDATREVSATLVQEEAGPMHKDIAVGVASLGMLKSVQRQIYEITVPHCQKHDDGAALEIGSETDMINPAICFRSHGYLRQFCELNGTQPRR